LRSSFAEVWAVDQEPGMVEVVAAKAAASGAEGISRTLSILPADALAAQQPPSTIRSSAELGPYVRDGHLTETVTFAYELARKAPAA